MNMMKRFIVFALVLSMAFTFTSCKKKPSVVLPSLPSIPLSPPVEPEWENAGETLIDWIKSGIYTYTYVAEISIYGVILIQEGTVAEDDGAILLNCKNNFPSIGTEAISVHAIMKDNLAYLLNDDKKTYAYAENNEEGVPDIVDFNNMQYAGVGGDYISGEWLAYREYSVAGGTTRFYMEGSVVRLIDVNTDKMKMQMIITDASSEVPAGTFDIPEDYVESENVLGFEAKDIREEFEGAGAE